MTTDNPEEAQIQRKQSSFSSDRSRFQSNSSANSQYFSLYQARELQLRERVLESCDDRILQGGAWKSAAAAGSIVHLEANQLSYVVGTIYMDMPLKPNVLDEITRESWVAAPPPRSNYRSANDVVILEDSNGRVPLSGDCLKKYSLTTGMVCAVLGFEGKDGTFHCQDICFPNYPPPSLLANPPSDIQVDGNKF